MMETNKPNNRNLLIVLGEWLEQQTTRRQTSRQSGINLQYRRSAWLPTPGNMIFTLFVIGGLLWAQGVGAISLGAPLVATTSTAGIPYQGRLADSSGTPITNTVNMIFRLYAAASGGVPLWEEGWTGTNSVQVSDGLFNVMLGSLIPIPQAVITGNPNLFLGITVGADSEMSPRVQLGSVPFAIQALTVPDGSITKAKLAPDISLVSPEGWLQALTSTGVPETWTYVSASAFTVPEDVTTKYKKGAFLKFTQGTIKYAVVLNSSYSTPSTTVTILTNTDYTIANAPITENYYSYEANPQGWPGWFNYTVTWGGFSSDPTYNARYHVIGNLIHVRIGIIAPGASNSQHLTLTMPVAAAFVTAAARTRVVGIGYDNGVFIPNGSPADLPNNANVLTCYRTTMEAVNSWTNSGNKFWEGEIFYEF